MKVFFSVLGWGGGVVNNVVRMGGNGIGFGRPESASQLHHRVITTSIYASLTHL